MFNSFISAAVAYHKAEFIMKLCDFEVGLDQPLFLMAGPCVIESEQLALDTAGELQQICKTLTYLLSLNLLSIRPTVPVARAFAAWELKRDWRFYKKYVAA